MSSHIYIAKVSRKPCQFQELSRPKMVSHREQQIPESSCQSKGQNKNLNQNIHWFDCHGWLGLAWSLAGSGLYWEMTNVCFLCWHVFSEVQSIGKARQHFNYCFSIVINWKGSGESTNKQHVGNLLWHPGKLTKDTAACFPVTGPTA